MEEFSINLTPLIDVVFLLLIFFMVTTTFSRETRLLVNLPEAQALEAVAEPEQIEILVGRDGNYLINGRALVNNEMRTLMQGLELVSQGNHAIPIIILADAQATHQAVVTAMDAIGQVGFGRLSIATQRPVEPDAGATP